MKTIREHEKKQESLESFHAKYPSFDDWYNVYKDGVLAIRPELDGFEEHNNIFKKDKLKDFYKHKRCPRILGVTLAVNSNLIK